MRTALGNLRYERALEWARYTDPALGLDALWATDLPAILRELDRGVDRLEGRWLPVAEIPLLLEAV